MSKGEEKVEKLLRSHNLYFQKELSFPDLKSLKGNLLRFDFAVFKGR